MSHDESKRGLGTPIVTRRDPLTGFDNFQRGWRGGMKQGRTTLTQALEPMVAEQPWLLEYLSECLECGGKHHCPQCGGTLTSLLLCADEGKRWTHEEILQAEIEKETDGTKGEESEEG